jgi:hypothetical protein
MYQQIVSQMKKGLGQLDGWLAKTVEYAAARGFDPNVLVTFRLAPNQFAFARQVQTACDTAKLATARLTGKEAPTFDDSEKTIDELRARIGATIAWLDGASAEDFAAAAERVVTQPRWEGKTMLAADYFVEHAVPNFFFHLTTAYAILRHNGVELGKRDFLGKLSMRDPG